MATTLSENRFYDNFLIEIRPRLQSVNILINLKRRLSSPSISITNDDIFIIDDNFKYKIPLKSLRIVPNSLNNMNINDNFISFRFATTNDTFGTFKSEILHLKTETDKSIERKFFESNSTLSLECTNCSQVYCKENFKRILPLPSETSDPSEWFCHAHGPDKNANINPKIDDIFYSTSFAHINSQLLKNILKSKTNLVCNRCLAWIGTIENENSHRIWFNTIKFSNENRSLSTIPLNDVYLTIRNVLKDTLLNSAKVILQCQVNKDQIDYILLWIIEKKLNVLVDDDQNDYNDIFMAKILFKFVSGSNNIVNQWLNDVIVANVSVSKPMMIDVLKYLYKMNKLLPKEWNFSNDFYVSYLPLYNNDLNK